MNALDIFGYPLVSMGITRPEGNGYQQIQSSTKETYRKLVLKDGRMVGAILMGQIQKAGIFSTLLKKKINVVEYIPFLMSDRLNFAELMPLIKQHGDRFTEAEYRELNQRPSAARI